MDVKLCVKGMYLNVRFDTEKVNAKIVPQVDLSFFSSDTPMCITYYR